MNYVHAGQSGFWTNAEAAAYSMGCDPKFVNVATAAAHLAGLQKAEEFRRRLDLIERAIQMGDLIDRFRPHAFINWAVGRRLEMPQELIVEVTASKPPDDPAGAELAKLRAEIATLRQQLQKQSLLLSEPGPRRLKTYYTIVAGMAGGRYGFRPGAARNTATNLIKADIERIGLSLSDDSILDLLREAAMVLDITFLDDEVGKPKSTVR